MTESELADEVARRTGLTRSQVVAVLSTLDAIARERELLGEGIPLDAFAAPGDAGPFRATQPFIPSASDVDALIAAAARHPLGLEFLLHGDLCAVAIMFQTHAFTVDAARERLGKSVPS